MPCTVHHAVQNVPYSMASRILVYVDDTWRRIAGSLQSLAEEQFRCRISLGCEQKVDRLARRVHCSRQMFDPAFYLEIRFIDTIAAVGLASGKDGSAYLTQEHRLGPNETRNWHG